MLKEFVIVESRLTQWHKTIWNGLGYGLPTLDATAQGRMEDADHSKILAHGDGVLTCV